ncbi:hypothetical protein PUMCH_000875 [Australozyma saopauloensis]|uniref:Amino acid permease/ SLC12A domain-containing protein n=1 Tax=Australozyma saopauloensis TaxID=291208 RepID=A0AAX4H543_9ASCO|nr:hypothetical protein PUMCH_000875 [[Candida] saopauloensis]
MAQSAHTGLSQRSSFSHNDVPLFPSLFPGPGTGNDALSQNSMDSTQELRNIFKNSGGLKEPLPYNGRNSLSTSKVPEDNEMVSGSVVSITNEVDLGSPIFYREQRKRSSFSQKQSVDQITTAQASSRGADLRSDLPDGPINNYLISKSSIVTLTSEIDLSDPLCEAKSHLSLDSSVLAALAAETDLTFQKDKFPYLSRYASMVQLKQRSLSKTNAAGVGDAELVFALSGLDDYNLYLRSTELEEAIEERVKQRQAPENENILAIVGSSELAQNYASQDTDNVDVHRRNKLTKARLPWSKFNDDRNLASRSVMSELRQAGEIESLVDSSQSGVFLHRKLKVRHLQMISFGGTLGVGLYLNSGKAISIAGGLGTVLAFMIVGIIVLASISSMSEMVTFVSVVDGVSGLCSRFVDESFGFAAGWVYFISFSVGLAAELVASAILLSYFTETKVLSSTASTVGFVTLCFLFCVVSNMITVQILGEIEYIASFFKVVATLIFIIVMIVINRGGMGDMGVLGFKYWDYLKSDFAHNVIFGPMRPTFDLRSNGVSPEQEGIGGDLGRFLALLTAILIATYAYSGTEIVCIAACEAKDPRIALPKATKRVFWRILLFYCLASFVVSLNIYAGDPRLLRYYYGSAVTPKELENNFAFHFVGGDKCRNSFKLFAGMGNGSQSPWAVAFQSAGLCNWSSVVNGVLFVFALSCGNSQLYASSRTIYALALQRKAPRFLTKCNRHGIPYYAVLVASCPALSAFICLSEKATVVFQNLTSLISSAGVLVWFSMCLAYIRFYFGLKKRPDIISREDKAYPYRSPFQPYLAWIGMIGLAIIILANGYVVFLTGFWNTMFFFSSYGALILFAILYCSHRIVNGSSMLSLEALDFDSGKRETDIFIWDGGKEYNRMKFRDLPHKMIDFVA